MSLVANPFLSDRSLKIRAKAIPWDGYQRAGLLGQDDVHLIQRVAQSRDKAEPVLDAEGETYAALYIRLLNKLSRNDTLQFILVLLADFIADREERITLLINQPDSPYPPLLKLLDSQDDFVRLKASAIASTILSYDRSPADNVIAKLLQHLSSLVQQPNEPEGQDVAVQCLESVLRVSRARSMCWGPSEGKEAVPAPKVIEGLVHLLRASPSPQMQYQLAFCFWLLTFEDQIASEINAHYNLIPLLLDVSKRAIKEKVIRVVLASFRNLVTEAPKANLAPMLVAKVLPYVQTLQGRKFSDDEIKEDVDFLVEELKSSFEGLTTWDEYKSELASGQLTWSPPHKNDDFWRDNAPKLVDRDREQLKVLVHILMSSHDPTTLAVAANDLAQFVKFHDGAKKAIDDLGAKARVMELMAHADPDVKYQSLVATQRLLSHAWA
ncbi:ATPase, V1 complex, subunit H [Rhodotorula diobovata]|uniref:V-type proton ATPase subunit H n=1 Tax=Rhodotorula diobovata TaxID=5288 RepID=A0A5C5FR10_9BASI|nr:ATPase, V1 complex, subunit H [Rhodotorula diobovata]